jgi:ABC-type branched-subunit amino acid transport system substrate-binding protein
MRAWHYGDMERASRLSLYFSNLSFVGANSLAGRLKDAGTISTPTGSKPYTDGVFVSQVVPNYQQDKSDAVLEYTKLLAATGAAPTFTSLEGYIAARVFLAGLDAHTGTYTSESLIAAFENMPELALGLGATAGFQPGNHNYSKSVWGTSISADGTFKNIYYWREGSPISFFE